MRAAAVMALVVGLARVASGDATAPGEPARDWLATCSMMDGPLRRASSSGLKQRARKAMGDALSLTSIGQKHLVLSRTGSDSLPPATVVVRAGSLERVASVPTFAPTLVEEANSGEVLGLLHVDGAIRDGGRMQLISLDNKPRWTAAAPASGRNAAVALAAGDLIVIALFFHIATGSELIAVDARTGAPRWTADVAQLEVGHSKYWNDVALSLDKNRVVMRGYEAGGCYEQTFDLATGRRLSFRTNRKGR